MNTQAITVCIHNSVLLKATLRNMAQFKRFIVVTIGEDDDTISLCRDMDIECHALCTTQPTSTAFPLQIDRDWIAHEALQLIDRSEWVALIEAGVFLPCHFRERLAALNLDIRYSYHFAKHLMCPSLRMFQMVSACEPWDVIPGVTLRQPRGFTLFCPNEFRVGLLSSVSQAQTAPVLPMTVLQLQVSPPIGDVLDGDQTQFTFPREIVPARWHASTTAIVGYFPGGRWKEVMKHFHQGWLLDRFELHSCRTDPFEEFDRRENERLWFTEREQLQRAEIHILDSDDSVETILDQSLDLVYFSGAASVKWFPMAIRKWLPKLKDNSVICGDLFGLGQCPENTKTVSALLGAPDSVLSDGFWWKRFHPSAQRLCPTGYHSDRPSTDIIVCVSQSLEDQETLMLSIASVRLCWPGPIHVIYPADPGDALQIACALFGVILHHSTASVAEHDNDELLLIEKVLPALFRRALVIKPGTLAVRGLDEAFSLRHRTYASLRDPYVIDRSDGVAICSSLPSLQAQATVQDFGDSYFVVCTGNPVYWSIHAWERWCECEAEVTLRSASGTRVGDDVSVVILVTPRYVGELERAWLTWGIPLSTRIVMILLGVRRSDFWLPGPRQPDVVRECLSSVAEDLRPELAALAVSCNTKRIAFVPPNAKSLVGAQLWIDYRQACNDVIVHTFAELEQRADKANLGEAFFGIVTRTFLEKAVRAATAPIWVGSLPAFVVHAAAALRVKHSLIDAAEWGWVVERSFLPGVECQFPATDASERSRVRIAVAVNVYDETLLQVEECFNRLAKNLPDARVCVFLDGVDRPDVVHVAGSLGFLTAAGEHLGSKSTWNLWWLRMLRFFSQQDVEVCLKVDTDTMIDAAPVEIPRDDYFGDVHGNFVHGGITGLSYKAIRILLDRELLELTPEASSTRREGFMEDRLLARVLASVGIQPTCWSECQSRARTPVLNEPLQYAIVHPRWVFEEDVPAIDSINFNAAPERSSSVSPQAKILVYACDKPYFDYTKASLASFFEHHRVEGWTIVFLDVGLDSSQRAELASFGDIVDYHRCCAIQQYGIVYPAGRARMRMLADFVGDDVLLVYLDSDTLVFECLDDVIAEFTKSRAPIAIAAEDSPGFGNPRMHVAWRDASIPSVFVDQDRWRNAAMLNTGVLFAQGSWARELGEVGLVLYDKYSDSLMVAEQGIIASILYEKQIPTFHLPVRYNCFIWEQYLTHAKGLPYVGAAPTLRGERVAIRHFCGRDAKEPLEKAIPLRAVNETLEGVRKRFAPLSNQLRDLRPRLFC